MGRRRGAQEGVRLFQERGYRIRLLSAAFRNHMHWSEFIGGDVVISPPHIWQARFNNSSIEVRARIDNPVDPEIVNALLRHFEDFRRAYEERGLDPPSSTASHRRCGRSANSSRRAMTSMSESAS